MNEFRVRKFVWLVPLSSGLLWIIPVISAIRESSWDHLLTSAAFDRYAPGLALIVWALYGIKTSIVLGANLVVNYAVRRRAYSWSEVVFARVTARDPHRQEKTLQDLIPLSEHLVTIRLEDGGTVRFRAKHDQVSEILRIVDQRAMIAPRLERGFKQLEESVGNPSSHEFIGKASLIASSAALLLFLANLNDIQDGYASDEWPRASGTVTVFEATQYTLKDRSRTTYSFKIRYEYTVNGNSYTSDRYEFEPFTTQNEAEIRRLSRRYSIGSSIDVLYSPRNPKIAVLQPGFSYISIAWVATTGMVLALGLSSYALNMSWLRKSRRAFEEFNQGELVSP